MKVACSPSVKTGRHTAFLGWSILAIFVLPLAAPQQAWIRAIGRPSDDNSTLMLVRAWDADTGLLTGWLPVHSLAIQLELIGDRRPAPHFEPEEAVQMTWPRTRKNPSGEAHVGIAPMPRVFEGESWLPVNRDANLVRIDKRLFVIRSIILNGGPWRQSARPAGSMAREESAR